MRRTLLRSLATSLATTALDAGLFALCAAILPAPALLAARWMSGAVGAVANFAVNRRWSFRAGGEAVTAQAVRYAAAAAVSVTATTVLWWALREATGWDPRSLHLVSMALVWPVVTFPLMRGWVFRARAARRDRAGELSPCSSAAGAAAP
jgi:putative flippase GtrA